MLQKVLLKSLDTLLALGASRGMKQPLLQTGEHPPIAPEKPTAQSPELPQHPQDAKPSPKG
jgi:hypothetical protein